VSEYPNNSDFLNREIINLRAAQDGVLLMVLRKTILHAIDKQDLWKNIALLTMFSCRNPILPNLTFKI